MDYVGKRVIHKSKRLNYGEGEIVSQVGNRIQVKFESKPDPISFEFPVCFKNFLQLIDADAIEHANEANRIKESKDKTESEKRLHEAYIRLQNSKSKNSESKTSRTVNKTVDMPIFTSVEDFCADQERLLNSEIDYLRNNGGKRIKIMDGKLVERKDGKCIYSFESETELSLPDNTQISVWSGRDKIPATIINCEDFNLIIAIGRNIGETIPIVEFSAEPWKLIQYLIERLNKIKENKSDIVTSIICEGRKRVQYTQRIKKGQETALTMSISQPITFIWGPPGTGKTETLANIAHEHLNKGYRVLMLSYSNVSVDGAIQRVFKKDGSKTSGKLVRYGYPKDKALMQHEYLTSYNLTLKNHPELLNERNKLIEEKKHTSRTISRYVEIGKRLTDIKNLMKAEEKKAVQEAKFVATTVSKAIADKLLYESTYDTVIFDEASMACDVKGYCTAGTVNEEDYMRNGTSVSRLRKGYNYL